MPHLTYSIVDNLAVIVLSNPPQNRLSPEMLEELTSALDVIGNSDARALLLRAEGEDFSFGGDIVPWVDMTERQLRTLFENYLNTFNRFERLSIPTIAAVRGLCFGGGLELAIRADVIIAADTAHFGHPEQSLAIVTLLGGTYRVAERAGRSKAIEWALTSERVPAEVMAQHGVVSRVVPAVELEAEALAFARRVASGPTKARAAHKALLRIWATGGTAAADEAMFDIALPLFPNRGRETCFADVGRTFQSRKASNGLRIQGSLIRLSIFRSLWHREMRDDLGGLILRRDALLLAS